MRGLLRLLLPLRCLGCGTHVPEDDGVPAEPLCLSCALRIREPTPPRCPRCDLPRGTGRDRPAACGGCDDWPPVLTGARTAAVLEPPADALVRALKYGGWRAAAGPMARRMVARARCAGLGGAGVVVPVPTTPERVRRRGYNQARVLAEALGAELGLPVAEALVRRPARASQVALQVDQRRANVLGAFEPGPEARLAGTCPHTILVDDVLTTGATAGAAAEALASLGAESVTLLAFARALPRPLPRGDDPSAFIP